MAGPIGDNQIHIFASDFNLLQYVILVEVYEKYLTSYRYEVGKWKSILIVFSDDWRHSFVVVQQKLTCGSYLKVSCSVEVETILMNILYSITLKPIGPSCILNRSFVYAWLWPHEPPERVLEMPAVSSPHFENSRDELSNILGLYSTSGSSHLFANMPLP